MPHRHRCHSCDLPSQAVVVLKLCVLYQPCCVSASLVPLAQPQRLMLMAPRFRLPSRLVALHSSDAASHTCWHGLQSGMDMPLFALANMNVNFTQVFACESDHGCRRLIKHVHKASRVYRDIVTRPFCTSDATDLYIWGAPCQPFSTAGKNVVPRTGAT